MFDLLHVEGQSLRERSYVERRRALETLFQREGLAAPWTLCPSTNDAEVARGWLAWSVAGVEGCVFKDGGESYRPGERSWRKFRNRMNCISCNSSYTFASAVAADQIP